MGKPTTVEAYLAGLPEDRREAIEAIREVVLANLDEPFEEGIQYGMIGYYLPHSVYPDGYHCDPRQPLPFASIANQKRHIGLYLFCIYGNGKEEARFREEWVKAGKKLDMGKACVRVKKLEDVPLKVVGRAFKRMTAKKFLKHYEAAIPESKRKKATKKVAEKTAEKTVKKTAKKTAKKAAKKVAKKTAKKVAKKTTKKMAKKVAKKTTRKAKKA